MCTYPVQPVCTSLSSLLFILLFIMSHILFLHILLVFAHLTCLAHLVLHFSLFYYTFYSLFLFLPIYIYIYIYIYICSCVVLLLYNLYSLHCPLSGPDLIYISLLIIPCIIYHVTNKETLTLDYGHEFCHTNGKTSGFLRSNDIEKFSAVWGSFLGYLDKQAAKPMSNVSNEGWVVHYLCAFLMIVCFAALYYGILQLLNLYLLLHVFFFL